MIRLDEHRMELAGRNGYDVRRDLHRKREIPLFLVIRGF
jgi:hypothetical protein